ncbi:unnamed protein product, partial [Hapterophycus canaliculatus]
EQICALHDELEASESHQELIEDALDMRTQQLFHLQKALVLHSNGGGESGDSGAGTDQQASNGRGGTASTATVSGASSPIWFPPRNHHLQQRPSTAPHPATAVSSTSTTKNRGNSVGGKMDGQQGKSSSTTPSALSGSRRSPSTSTAASTHNNDSNTVSTATTVSASTETTTAGTGEDTRHIPPTEDLISFPRFKPHALTRPTLFSTDNPVGGVALHEAGILTGGGGEQGGEGDRGGGGGGSGVGRGASENTAGLEGGKLLNAWEKIKELEELVESSRSHNERLLEDLEEVQTDKVSMEYLLREKLERLVQSEIEARVARMHQDGGVDEILRRQLDGLRVEAAARARSEAALREEIHHLKRSAFAQHSSTNRQGSADDKALHPEESAELPAGANGELEGLRSENAKLRQRVFAAGKVRKPHSSYESTADGAALIGVDQIDRDDNNQAALESRCKTLLGERKAMQA